MLRSAWEPLEEATLDDFDLTIDVNIRGPFLCAKYAVPWLKKAGRSAGPMRR